MRLAIIGSGVVGKATGIGFLLHGNNVIFCDIDKEKLTTFKKEGHNVTDNVFEAVDKSEVSFVCLPTPTINGAIDISCLENAVKDIGRGLRRKDEYHLVVIRSTVLPSTTRCKIIPLLELVSQLRTSLDFGVCANPEFLRKETALEDFLKPSRIVIGQLDQRSGDILQELYSPFSAPLIRTDLDTAEMTKYVSNSYLSTKISFFNEVHMICKDIGLDPDLISRVAAMDPRIGTYGTCGGKPFEGECLPKDLEAFVTFIESKEHNPKMLKAAQRVNEEIMRRCNNG